MSRWLWVELSLTRWFLRALKHNFTCFRGHFEASIATTNIAKPPILHWGTSSIKTIYWSLHRLSSIATLHFIKHHRNCCPNDARTRQGYLNRIRRCNPTSYSSPATPTSVALMPRPSSLHRHFRWSRNHDHTSPIPILTHEYWCYFIFYNYLLFYFHVSL